MTGPGLAKCGRVGHSMLRALAFIRNHPGCSKFACARHIGEPRGRDPAHAPSSLYQTIDRCIDLGFVDATMVGRIYSLHIATSGAALLEERTQECKT
jgi:hypothetical protein